MTLSVALLLVLGACGTDEKAQQAAADAAEKQQEAAAASREAQADARKAREEYERCDQGLGGLLEAAQDLDSRLDVGLNYDEYSDRVADVNVAYNNIDFKNDLDFTCISAAGLSLEKALNKYVDAYRVWDECFADINCDNDSIDGELQTNWFAASSAVDRAKRGIGRLKAKAERADTRAESARDALEEATAEAERAEKAAE